RTRARQRVGEGWNDRRQRCNRVTATDPLLVLAWTVIWTSARWNPTLRADAVLDVAWDISVGPIRISLLDAIVVTSSPTSVPTTSSRTSPSSAFNSTSLDRRGRNLAVVPPARLPLPGHLAW